MPSSEQDGIETAQAHFGLTPTRFGDPVTVSVDEFLAWGVENHRVMSGVKCPSDVFPPNNRPRGLADILSVEYHMRADSRADPIMVLEIVGDGNAIRLVMLDGVHRLAAAAITGRNVTVQRYR